MSGTGCVAKQLALALLLAALAVVALARPIEFRDQSEESRFRALTEQLRCVMCQNQSLADSNAPIAHDLRIEIVRLMREGKSDREIKQYLVARYTDFVLYQPEVKPMTWLLWFGPGLLIIGGAIVIFVIVRNHGRGAPPSPPANDSQEW
jgi:cytochrome c-type biogenesis protein CcmH